MAKKKDNKKAKAKPAPKKQAKKVAKPAPKKAVKPAAKKKSAPKPVVKKKTELKKVSKPVSKTKPVVKTKVAAKPAAKSKDKVAAKHVAVKEKEIKGKKPVGKPIDAVAKKGKDKKADKVKGKKKGKSSDGEEDEEDVDVKDDYEKNDEEDSSAEIEGGELDEAGMIDLEGSTSVPDDDDEDEVPEKRGRGRRKKNEGKSSGGSMEAYIRNRPVQIDINKPLIKKGNINEPKPFVNTKDARTRYSDKELAEFKGLILEKLKEAQTDYDLLKLTLSNEDNHGTDDTSPSFKLLEDGSDVMSKEETAQLAARQEKYIVNLKNALIRIENKSYGICRVTGKLIPKERLRSVPHATLGIDVKLGQVN